MDSVRVGTMWQTFPTETRQLQHQFNKGTTWHNGLRDPGWERVEDRLSCVLLQEMIFLHKILDWLGWLDITGAMPLKIQTCPVRGLIRGLSLGEKHYVKMIATCVHKYENMLFNWYICIYLLYFHIQTSTRMFSYQVCFCVRFYPNLAICSNWDL